MREQKNIDRIFQENLKNFEVSPPNKAWDSIEKKLVVSSKKKHIPMWLKITSVAALLLLFFSIGAIYFTPPNKFSFNLFNTNVIIEKNNSQKDSIINAIIEKEASSIKKTTTKLPKLKTDKNLSKIESSTTKKENEKSTFNKKILSKNSLITASNVEASKKRNSNQKKEITDSKFTVSTIFAPIYANSFGDGSGVDSQFKNNPTSGSSSYSYGVKFAYQLNDKFSLQSGVNLINLGYTTNNIYVNSGVASVSLANISSQPIQSKNTTVANSEKGSINQVFGYVEIPVELKYNVTNGKFGVNLVGGFSTLLLNRDEVFVETNDFSQSLGSSNNLRSVNFSGNIGVDIDYLIHKNLYINVSPMFKMQTSTFSKNAGSIQPYYLGVYTGLNYKF